MKARILGCVALAGLTALVPAASAATKAHPAHRGVVVDWRAHSHTATHRGGVHFQPLQRGAFSGALDNPSPCR